MEDVAKAASNHHWGEGYLEINWGWANMRKHVRATQSLEIKHLWFECLNFSVISSCFHKNPHHGKGLINQSGRRDVSEFSPYLGMAPYPITTMARPAEVVEGSSMVCRDITRPRPMSELEPADPHKAAPSQAPRRSDPRYAFHLRRMLHDKSPNGSAKLGVGLWRRTAS